MIQALEHAFLRVVEELGMLFNQYFVLLSSHIIQGQTCSDIVFAMDDDNNVILGDSTEENGEIGESTEENGEIGGENDETNNDNNEQFNSLLNSDFIDPDIVATIAALGSFEGSNYMKGDECVLCIGDLIKFLRIEDKKTCDIRRQIARSKTMEKDLLPIFVKYFDDNEIVDALMRLLVNLTMPALLSFEKEVLATKTDKLHEKLYMEVTSYLRWYKDLFVFFNVMKVFSSHLGHLLQLGKTNRTDEDDLMLERILIIIRNILHVPSDSLEAEQLHNSISTHDKLVLSIVEYGVADLLFYLCGNKDEEQHCLLSLEIISLIFGDFNADILATQSQSHGNVKVDKELQELKMKEDLEKQIRLNMKNTRHSRFGGTFVVQGKKSITEKDLIYHKNIKKIKNLSFDEGKNIQRHTRSNAIARDNSCKRLSTANVRCTLKDLALKFLDLCYNPLMKKAKSFLCRGQSTSDCDESFYLWSCAFFMEFNRKVGFKLELVAETLSSDSFAYVLQIIFKFHEDIKGYSAKMINQQQIGGKRLHFAIKAYQEILQNLSLMIISNDTKVKEISGVIQSIIFYQQEYRELPTLLLKQFTARVFTKSYLTDLIECAHLYIRMLDTYTKSNTLIVQQTKKKAKKKKTISKKKKNMLSEREMLEMWEGDIEKDVLNILSAANISTSNARPFDGSLDYSMEQQRVLCKHNIQDLLKSGSFKEAVALYKAAQEVWPSSPSFGMPDMAIIDELNVIKSIFLSEEKIPEIMSRDNDDESNPHESESTSSEMHTVSEHKFQSTDYLMLYARPGIVKCYCYLLDFFETNSSATNHAVVKMLYRIASKIAMIPLMFQISFFTTLKRILAAPNVDTYKDLKKFAAFIVRRFIVGLKENPLICVDAIFWKTTDDVMAMEHGYDAEKIRPNKKKDWTPPEEEELRLLFEKWIDKAEAIDICDMIAQDMTTSSDKQRMDVKNKIIEMQLVQENADILKKKPKSKVDWLPDELKALKHLYEEFQYEKDPVALIQEKLDTMSRKKIIKKLESVLGVRKADLYVNRSIWSKDDDEELRILYTNKSETLTGDTLLEALQEHIPKTRTMREIKDALIRLRLQRDENSSDHFWTDGELAIISKHEASISKKDMVQNIKSDLQYIEASCIIQQLVRMSKMDTVEGAKLLLEISDSDGEDEEDEETEEEEFDFFDFPKHVKSVISSHSTALKWIADTCSKAITSREDLLDYDTVFIIAREKEHHEALTNAEFKIMLQCLGAVPPLSSYETYWKITSDVSDNILKRAYCILQGDCELSDSDQSVDSFNDIKPCNKPVSSDHEACNSDSDDDMDNFLDKLRNDKAYTTKHSGNSAIKLSEDLSEEVSNEQGQLPKFESYEDENISDKENQMSMPSSLVKRKQTAISDTDSESETTEQVVFKNKRTAMINFSDSDD